MPHSANRFLAVGLRLGWTADAAAENCDLLLTEAGDRLFAPFLPFVTEEAWSRWRDGSVHRAPWPTAPAGATGDERGPLALAAELLRQVRGAKSRAKVGLSTPVTLARVTLPADRRAAFAIVRDDLVAAGRIADLRVVDGDEVAVEVELAVPARPAAPGS